MELGKKFNLEMVILEGRLISGSALWMVIPLGRLRPGMGSFLRTDQTFSTREEPKKRKKENWDEFV
jgi:hypothetical protein